MGGERGCPVRVRTAVAEAGIGSMIGRAGRGGNDLDYLAARVHGRRGRMAEKERLDGLCRIDNLPDFFRAVFPETECRTIHDFQHRCVDELAAELAGLRTHISGPGGEMVGWTLVRFQIENVKVLLRACLGRIPFDEIESHLVGLPADLALDSLRLAMAESPEAFARLAPKGLVRTSLEKALEFCGNDPRSFFFEAALDCSYFQGLIIGTDRLAAQDRDIIRPMVCQEVDMFHLMLVTRGKYHYNVTPELLEFFHVPGTKISRSLLLTMLRDPDLSVSAGRVGGRVYDAMTADEKLIDGTITADAATLENLAWKRLFRLANLAFRQSHMGLGAILGFGVLRRIEVANLITISEAIRYGMAPGTIRRRLIPGTDGEGTHV